MTPPWASLRWGPGVVEFDDVGRILAVRHDAQPTGLLRTGGTLRLRAGGSDLGWRLTGASRDSDEVEFGYAADGLHIVVRHSVVAGWGLRVALTNTGADPLTLESVVLGWEPAAERAAWALAAGASGAYAIHPVDGRGQVLGGLLRLGSFDAVDASGLGFGQIELAPGGRFVVQWDFAWYPSPRAFDGRRLRQVPRRLWLPAGETATIEADEDTAVMLPAAVAAERVGDHVELTAEEPADAPVEVRSAAGSTRYVVHWVERYADVLHAAAIRALAGPRTPAGVVRLGSIDAALAVQRLLSQGAAEDAETAEDALGLMTAEVVATGPADPRTVSFLCGEYERTGDPWLVDVASDAVGAATRASPGLGIAATQLCVARLLRGLDAAPVLAHLRALAGSAHVERSEAAADWLSRRAARTELGVVTLSRQLSTMPRAGEARTLLDELVALGPWMGAGLRGGSVRPLPVGVLAHLSAVLALTSDEVSSALRDVWGCDAHELGRRAQSEVLGRIAGRPAGAALSWLSMVRVLL